MTLIWAKKIAWLSASVSLALAVLLSASNARAVSIAIDNFGFEEPNLAGESPIVGDEVFTFETPPGWELYDPSGLIPADANLSTSFVGVWDPTSAFFTDEAPEGKNVGAILLAQAPGSGIAGFSQTLSSTLKAKTRYSLKVEVGNPGAIFAGFPGYRIQLLAGETVVAEDDNILNPAEGSFETSIVSFTTSANTPNLGEQLEIRLLNILDGSGLEVDFDNVRLEATPVPETTSLLGLVVVGALGINSRLKRQKTK